MNTTTEKASQLATHTPGPWKKGTPGHGRHCVYSTKANGKGICVMSNTQTTSQFEIDKYGDHPANLEADANGHLIAAAPELLEALLYLVSQVNLSKLNIRKDFSLINAHAAATKAIYHAKGGN